MESVKKKYSRIFFLFGGLLVIGGREYINGKVFCCLYGIKMYQNREENKILFLIYGDLFICFQIFFELLVYCVDTGLYRINGRGKKGCRRNKCFFVGKNINVCIFIIILFCFFDRYVWLFKKKSKEGEKMES